MPLQSVPYHYEKKKLVLELNDSSSHSGFSKLCCKVDDPFHIISTICRK